MTWQEAYHNLDPQKPLEFDDPLLMRALFKPYIGSVIEELRLNRDRNVKLLFSGHVGCGKSTFFNLLGEELKDDFFVVKLRLDEFADRNDMDHIDILLGLVLKCAEEAQGAGFPLDEQATGRVQELAKSLAGLLEGQSVITNAERQQVDGSAGVGLPNLLSWLRLHFVANFQLQHDIRKVVRERFRPRISEFIKSVNTVLDSIQISTGSKALLVLVDDSDKPRPPERARKLFADAAEHLASPHANMVYSVDASVSCHEDYKVVVGRFGGYQKFMPALRVQNPDPKRTRNPDKIAVMRQLLRCRIPDTAIADDNALDDIAYLGGGHVRETIRLCRAAVFAAAGSVKPSHINVATVDMRNEFSFPAPYTAVLKRCLDRPTYQPQPGDEERSFYALLGMSALLQYQNGTDKWYSPIPYLIPWLEKLP
jgi:energy-coupling factor transporter ATP-binding protein EcfA2